MERDTKYRFPLLGRGSTQLRERTKDYALRIIRLYSVLPKKTEAKIIGHQLLRSGTSVGAQYSEACRAKSDADFVSKIQGSLQELEESIYWLELLANAGIIKADKLSPLLIESEELIKYLFRWLQKLYPTEPQPQIKAIMPNKVSVFSFQFSSFIPVNRLVKAVIRRALTEDLGVRGDITSKATIPNGQKSKATIVAKSAGVIAGQNVASWVFQSLDKKVKYEPLAADGQTVEQGAIIARIDGLTEVILTGERTALNLMGRCCGVATLTRRFVEAVALTNAKVCETRKTAPGLRFLDKASVRVGGGVNHRFALFDAFLIKENHVAAAGGIAQAILACRESEWGKKKLRVMVEVRNFDEFQEALAANPDRIMFDNMAPEEIARCRSSLPESQKSKIKNQKSIELEATGGITLDNIRAYAETGVDFISIGALTHSVQVMDLSLLLE